MRLNLAKPTVTLFAISQKVRQLTACKLSGRYAQENPVIFFIKHRISNQSPFLEIVQCVGWALERCDNYFSREK